MLRRGRRPSRFRMLWSGSLTKYTGGWLRAETCRRRRSRRSMSAATSWSWTSSISICKWTVLLKKHLLRRPQGCKFQAMSKAQGGMKSMSGEPHSKSNRR